MSLEEPVPARVAANVDHRGEEASFELDAEQINELHESIAQADSSDHVDVDEILKDL